MPRVKIGPAPPDRATLDVEIARLRCVFRRSRVGRALDAAALEWIRLDGRAHLHRLPPRRERRGFLRLAAGFVSPRRIIDLRLTRLWLDYTAVTGLVAVSLVLALPALVAMLYARP